MKPNQFAFLQKRQGWTNLKKIKTHCNCEFLKTYPNSFLKFMFLFVTFDYSAVDCKKIHIFQIFKYVREVKQKVLNEAENRERDWRLELH